MTKKSSSYNGEMTCFLKWVKTFLITYPNHNLSLKTLDDRYPGFDYLPYKTVVVKVLNLMGIIKCSGKDKANLYIWVGCGLYSIDQLVEKVRGACSDYIQGVKPFKINNTNILPKPKFIICSVMSNRYDSIEDALNKFKESTFTSAVICEIKGVYKKVTKVEIVKE